MTGLQTIKKGPNTPSTHTWGSLESPINLINMFRLWEETGGNPCGHRKDMQTSQRKAPNGDFHHPHYLQNWFNEVLCICQEFLWHGCLETHVVSKMISTLWFLITIMTNNVGFSVMIIWLWQKPKVYTLSRNTSESITPQDLSLSIIISSIHVHFYVGFKHAISQFIPIFPAFGVLQWNRFHLILNIWPTLPLETPQPCVPRPKKAV